MLRSDSQTIRTNGPFGEYVDFGRVDGDALIVATHRYQLEPKRIILPHQLYVRTIEKMLVDANEVWVIPIRSDDWIKVNLPVAVR